MFETTTGAATVTVYEPDDPEPVPKMAPDPLTQVVAVVPSHHMFSSNQLPLPSEGPAPPVAFHVRGAALAFCVQSTNPKTIGRHPKSWMADVRRGFSGSRE
jgi:hypothetical protein